MPTPVDSTGIFAGEAVVDFAAGNSQDVFVTDTGSVFVRAAYGQPALLADGALAGQRALAVASGDSFALAVVEPAIALPNMTMMEAWRLQNFGTTGNLGDAADDADPDFDGIENLLEFGFGRNPHASSAGLLPRGERVNGNFEIRFTQPPGVSAVGYTGEYSTTLQPGDWHPVADTGVAPEHLFRMPIGTATKLFLRVNVSKTAP